MKSNLKRLFSLLMVLVMLGSMLPAVYADSTPAEEPEDNVTVLTDEDYAIVNDVFAQIDAMEDAPVKKNASETQLADAAAEIVMASENYVEGSLERNGNFFTWWTDEGIRCVYSPRMREIQDNMVVPEDPIADGAYNEPVATKGGWPSGNQVYLIGPYYGSDSSFTDQYKNEAKAIASAIGDTDGYTLYSGTAATVDKVADAVSNGAVVIFDSHGTTDYESGNDYVTGANNSYLCLETSTGMTNADYNDGALYGSGYAYINGATIANHMTSNSPAGIVWMAICLGMATDTLCEPMREKGVEVVYGYSQSVTFAGDYLYEETFWDNMCAGKDVATSVAAMKSKWGNWDWSTTIATYYGYTDGYSTISAARSDYAAFPIVVSDEDTHPGQRSGSSNYGADSLQTVKSTYTLFSQYAVSVQVNNSDYGSAIASGNTITAAPNTGYFAESATVVSGTATVTQNGNTFSVVAESDCTIQINFAAKTAVTVNFSGANVSGQTGYAGDSMSLPTAEAPEGYKFLGWLTAPLSGDTTEKPSYYTDSFIPTGNTTLYALYSYVDSTSGGGSGDYVKVTETPADWSGEYLIVYESGTDAYIFNSVDASNGYASATISDNTIASNASTDAEAVTIEAMSGGYAIKSKNGYIYGTSGSNKLNFNTSSQQLNTLSLSADGTVLITSNTSVLRFNATSGQYRFRYYKAASYSSQKAIALYVKDGSAGTTYYTSTLCEHENVTEVAAVAATCTEVGYTAGTQCDDCGSYVTGHEVVAALGHSWSDWTQTTAPGCETAGEQTRTCGNCGETQTQSVAATGHSFGDWVVTTAPTCTAEGEKTSTCTNCGATVTEAVAVLDHNYGEGTVTTAATCTTTGVMTYTCSACGNTTTEAIPALGHDYSEGVCTVCGEAEPENTSARYYIAANRSDTYFYMTRDLGTASKSRYQAVDSGLSVLPESITEPEDGYVFILTDNGDGTYSLQAEGAEDYSYLGWTSGNSGLLVDADSALALTVEVTDGIYSIHFAASDAERYLSLNGTAGNDYFAWYKEGQISNLVLIPVGGTTTEPTEPTEPEVTEPEVTEPEDTEPEESEPAPGAYVKVTSADQFVSGQYVMVVSTGYAPGVVDGTWMTAVKPIVSGDVVTDAAGGIWTLTVNGSSVTITDSNGVSIAPKGGNNNGLATGEYAWAWSFADGTFTFAGTGSDTVKLASNTADANNKNKFRAYKNTTVADTSKYPSAFTLYKLVEETVCEHLSTTTTTIGATGNTLGSVTVTCNDCGETISTESIPYLAGAVESWSMTLGGDLSVNFKIYVHETIRENAQIAVTVAGEAYDIGDIAVGEDGYYAVTVKLAAAQMADKINIQITNSNGQNAGVSKDYTVKQYADYILTDANNEFTDEDKALVQAMLNYGGAAQTYFGYNTENLVSTEFGEETPETAEEMVITDTSADITFYGASLIYKDRIAVRFYFTGNVEGKLFTVQGKEVEATKKDDLYYVEIVDIMPYELDQQFMVTSDGISVTYGPMNYIARMYEKGDASLQNLMKALYNYYWTALDYVTA